MPHFIAKAAAKWNAFYALAIYPPVSGVARKLRPLGRALRGLDPELIPTGTLPAVSWRAVVADRPVRLVEMQKAHGNVRHDELAILAKCAASIAPGDEIIEIGTFDGRTTLNLAINAPDTARVYTLDLPAEDVPAFSTMKTERVFIDKPQSGARFMEYRGPWAECSPRITQLRGDSARFDWSAHYGKAGLVFVDGSHAADYARHDSEEAFRLVAPGGTIVWHDYGVWKGLTVVLDEIEAARRPGLKRIRGTSLVIWRNVAQR